jgi:hypothetical protein
LGDALVDSERKKRLSCNDGKLLLLFVTPLGKVFEASFWVGLLLTSPIYICEIIWINRSDFLKDTIASAKKIA